MLTGKHVVLGVCGGIAAYKVVELASRLTKEGALVDVVMSEAATKFVTPLTFQAITHRTVAVDMFRLEGESNITHVSLGVAADVVVVAPATAHTVAKLALGLADDLVVTTALASTAPLIVAPAMEEHMYRHPATTQNLATLRARGATIVPPGHGRLASGRIGEGRLAAIEDIYQAITLALALRQDLAGRRIVVTAGGTQEPIDPVRYIGNRSSGKMGYAIAEVAGERGAAVTLISGPTAIAPPAGVALRRVETACEMEAAVREAIAGADALIMAAAVADYRVAQPAEQKIKKETGDLTIQLVRNPDILGGLAGAPLLKVGFAAETEDLLAHAVEKMRNKRLDMIVANDVSAPGSGFGSDTNRVTLLEPDGSAIELPLLSKREVAGRILDRVAALLATR
jgi:phosphopantothenoylcysteine decarboxylase/phosphopantothenate--cysteine ligase